MNRRIINNTSWVNPTFDLSILFFLILLTIIIEGGLIYLYAREKKYEDKAVLLFIVLLANFVSGLVGFMLGFLGI